MALGFDATLALALLNAGFFTALLAGLARDVRGLGAEPPSR
jgi:hypothetical protein